MALVVKDRVKEVTTTTGTADFVLGGAVLGFQTFSVIGNGNQTYYSCSDPTTGAWEVGIGTYSTTGPTLTRDTVLESSNSGSKVSFAAGTKDIFCTYPAERSVYLDTAGLSVTTLDVGTLGTSTANITTANITAGTVSTAPATGNDIANKTYVDNMAASALHYHTPVYVESPNTTGNLNATYNNGASGVGATLTNAGTQAAFTADGIAVPLNARVLIYNQTNATQNGIYTLTTVGSGSTNWVLTRATDADTYAPSSPSSLGQGDAFFVTNGLTGAGETYVCNTVGTITFGTTNITFVQISDATLYTAGTGLTLTGTEFSITNTGTAGTYGSSSNVPVFVTNAQGQVTSVTNTAIAITPGQVSGLAASATTDTTDASNITSGTLPTGRITGSYTGITGVGTLTAGTWNANVIGGAYGGTGLTSYAVGDLLYADTSSTLAKLADVAYGNVLLSGGVGTAPSYGKVSLTAHVTNTLAVANGGTGATTLTGYVYGNGTGAMTASTSIPNSATTATNANTASAIVARDASGNFSAGTITATLSGNASTATSATSATTATNLAGGVAGAVPYQSASGTTGFSAAGTSGQVLTSAGTSAPTWTTPATVNNGTLTMNVSGTGLSGSASFTANQSGSSTFTVTSNATSGNTASTIVARDASGNFSAGTITASLSGNASTATSAGSVTNSVTFNNGGGGGASGSTYNGSGALTVSYNTVGAPSTTGANASGTWGINISGNAANASTVSSITSVQVTTALGYTPYQIYTTTTNLDTTSSGVWRVNTGATGQPSGTEYGTVVAYDNVSDTGFQFCSDYSSNYLYWRSGNAPAHGGSGSWGTWRVILHSGNYNSYAPTLTGGGASGTWGINISGNAATATSATTATTATTATNWGSYGAVPGAGTSFGNANTIGRSDGSGYTYFYYINSNTSNSENPSVSQFIVTNGSDNFYRKASGAHVISQLGLLTTSNYNSYAPTLTGGGASGTWGISISGGLTATQPNLGYSVSGANIDYGGQGGPQVLGQSAGAAMMSFHRPGYYAINFGLGTDNQLRTGGWSRGGNYVVLDSGNYTSYSPSLGGSGASGTWGINVTGTASNITAYSINQNLNTTSTPTFTGIYINGVLQVLPTGLILISTVDLSTVGSTTSSLDITTANPEQYSQLILEILNPHTNSGSTSTMSFQFIGASSGVITANNYRRYYIALNTTYAQGSSTSQTAVDIPGLTVNTSTSTNAGYATLRTTNTDSTTSRLVSGYLDQTDGAQPIIGGFAYGTAISERISGYRVNLTTASRYFGSGRIKLYGLK